MSRPVTLFTGQWADLPLEKLAPLAYEMGYDGLELACWGDHFDVDAAASSKTYVKEKWELLSDHGLTCFAISNHLVGQAVCDRIDERHKAILPPDVWGDGDPEGVRKRAAKKMITTGKAARAFFNAKPGRENERRFPGGGERFHRFLDLAFALCLPADHAGVLREGLQGFRQTLAADPRRIRKGQRELRAWKCIPPRSPSTSPPRSARWRRSGNHKRFGFNYDPSHLGYQGVDYVKFIREFGRRIFHVHMKDAWWGHGDGTRGRLRRPHRFRRRPALLGFPLARPRRHRIRGHHRRAQRHRLPRTALGRVGGHPHGPRARRLGSGLASCAAWISPAATSPSTRRSTSRTSDDQFRMESTGRTAGGLPSFAPAGRLPWGDGKPYSLEKVTCVALTCSVRLIENVTGSQSSSRP